MLLKAVDKENMTVKEFWASYGIQDAITPCGEIRTAITRLCLNGVWKENCSYLVHDCRGFSVDEDFQQKKKTLYNWQIWMGLKWFIWIMLWI
jgi:hypothetical protein